MERHIWRDILLCRHEQIPMDSVARSCFADKTGDQWRWETPKRRGVTHGGRHTEARASRRHLFERTSVLRNSTAPDQRIAGLIHVNYRPLQWSFCVCQLSQSVQRLTGAKTD